MIFGDLALGYLNGSQYKILLVVDFQYLCSK